MFAATYERTCTTVCQYNECIHLQTVKKRVQS